MKTQTIRIFAGMCALTLILLGLGGCATTDGGGDGYKLSQTRSDISWAMVRYNNRVAAGFVTTAQQDQVKASHAAYQSAFDEALKAANSDLSAPTPDNVRQLANQLLGLLSSL